MNIVCVTNNREKGNPHICSTKKKVKIENILIQNIEQNKKGSTKNVYNAITPSQVPSNVLQ